MPLTYPHMCRDGHPEIGHSDYTDDEMCPLCRANNEIERLRAALRGQHCPGGQLDDNGALMTVGTCVDLGECGCDNGAALSANEQKAQD